MGRESFTQRVAAQCTGCLTQRKRYLLQLDLRPGCEGLPPEPSALQALRILELRGGHSCIHGNTLSSLTNLEVCLTLNLSTLLPVFVF